MRGEEIAMNILKIAFWMFIMIMIILFVREVISSIQPSYDRDCLNEFIYDYCLDHNCEVIQESTSTFKAKVIDNDLRETRWVGNIPYEYEFCGVEKE